MAYFPMGLGEPLGDRLVSQKSPLYHSGSVWYVSSDDGVDAAAPQGRDRLQPLATLDQAHTNAAAGDIIVLKDGHAETLSSGITISKDNLTIVGGGKNGADPTVQITPASGAGTPAITVSGAGVQMRNLWFMQPSASQDHVIYANGVEAPFRMVDCRVDMGDHSDSSGIEVSDGRFEFQGCNFVSVAAGLSEVPKPAIAMALAGTTVILDGVTFDGGSYGFEDGVAFEVESAATSEVIRADDISLLRGADMLISILNTGYIHVGSTSGSGQIRTDVEGAS